MLKIRWSWDMGIPILGKRVFLLRRRPGGWFNIKMPSYQYRKSHCGDKTILRPSYLHNGISYTSKMASLYWIRALVLVEYSSLRTRRVDIMSNLAWQGHFIKTPQQKGHRIISLPKFMIPFSSVNNSSMDQECFDLAKIILLSVFISLLVAIYNLFIFFCIFNIFSLCWHCCKLQIV